MKYIKLFESFLTLGDLTFKKVDYISNLDNLNEITPSETTIQKLSDIFINKLSDNITKTEMFRNQLVISVEMKNDGSDPYIFEMLIDFYEDEWFAFTTYIKPDDHKDDRPFDEVTYLCDQIQGVEDVLNYIY